MREKNKTLIFFAFFLLIVLVNNTIAVQVVEVSQQQTQPEKQGFVDKYMGFIKKPVFWYIVIGIVIFVVFLIGVFFLVKFLVKFIKKRNDIYYLMKIERLQLAKVQRRYPSNHWWKVEKNTPIRLARKDENGKLYISRPIGFHRGDYMTHEGNLIIALNLEGRKQYWFFPQRDLLIIPNKEQVKIVQRNDKGEKISEDVIKLPIAKEIVQFNENEILVFAESFSQVGMFLIPVLKAKDGKILDLSLPVYQTLKDVILGDFLYLQSADFVALSKKAVDMNPILRGTQKLNDSNQNVEVSSTNPNSSGVMQ